jgi:hypothetical protein
MPMFSILHPTVRPAKWRAIRDLWIDRARRPNQIEYLLGYHIDQLAEFSPISSAPQYACRFRVFHNHGENHPTRNGRSSLVDTVNLLASKAEGSILIVSADDQEAPQSWDEDLAAAIAEWQAERAVGAGDEFVMQVSTGTPNDAHRPELMTLQILSRAWYGRFGYVFHPRYTGMYADNEFSDVARHAGVVIDARHLVFQHKHPLFDARVPMDDWYSRGNAKHEYDLGRDTYVRRRALDFPPEASW